MGGRQAHPARPRYARDTISPQNPTSPHISPHLPISPHISPHLPTSPHVSGTPGHTNGCVSFFDDAVGAVFSGDALFINGCGRTDFQEGSAATLWESVTRQLFTLPDTTLVLPAHDYKGRRHSTIKHERDANERFALGRDGFVKHMAELQLPYPKKLDVSLPANLKCGLD